MIIRRYVRWLHTQWPAGTVEKLPDANPDGSTNVAGLYVVGDLTGIPLLKLSADGGVKAVRAILADPAFRKQQRAADPQGPPVRDLVIVGGGVSGMAAALEARRAGLDFEVLEATKPFSTVVDFPKGKPIYAYPTDMIPAGDMQFTATVKEALVDELRAQTLDKGIRPRMARAEKVARSGHLLEVVLSGGEHIGAHRVIVAIGRSGNFRKLAVPGEELDKVYNRLHDPKDFCDKNALVVGGGDSALETAIALAECGANVTLAYRKPEFSRPKPDNIDRLARCVADPAAEVAIERPVSERVTTAVGGYMGEHRKRGSIRLMMSSRLKEISQDTVTLVAADGAEQTMANDVVFSMIGREAPLEFFRRSGVHVRGEWRAKTWIGFAAFLVFCVFLYHWKAEFILSAGFPRNMPELFSRLGGRLAAWSADSATLLGTAVRSMTEPGFYYALGYSLCVVLFGIRRIRRRRTPYVTAQTLTLMAVQVVPLFVLPYLLLPWAGHNGWFEAGAGRWLADQLFPAADYGHGREFWRAVGFVLAWPLFFGNVFTDQPLGLWLAISAVQTLVLIPLMIYFWGKGAYCGWICSCGALAETMGDAHRHKMPHGPIWNRLNFTGQIILGVALVLALVRIVSWVWPDSAVGGLCAAFYKGLFGGWPVVNYKYVVDLFLAGVVGLGMYFWFSGRVWCRFACPLAALMHVYARFSRFRIFADKPKCISCNVCTSVCHQGIDIMNFANKGLPMEDPQCVRCSACVQECPTGVLAFGRLTLNGEPVLDRLAASAVRMTERGSDS